MVRKIAFSILFFFALHLQAECDTDFDVLVLFNSEISISLNKTEITIVFNERESAHHSAFPSDILVGTFTMTVLTTAGTSFNAISFVSDGYTNADGEYIAHSDHIETRHCILYILTDQSPTGVPGEYQLLDYQNVITTDGTSSETTFTRVIDTYMDTSQIRTLGRCLCHLPLFFRIEGV